MGSAERGGDRTTNERARCSATTRALPRTGGRRSRASAAAAPPPQRAPQAAAGRHEERGARRDGRPPARRSTSGSSRHALTTLAARPFSPSTHGPLRGSPRRHGHAAAHDGVVEVDVAGRATNATSDADHRPSQPTFAPSVPMPPQAADSEHRPHAADYPAVPARRAAAAGHLAHAQHRTPPPPPRRLSRQGRGVPGGRPKKANGDAARRPESLRASERTPSREGCARDLDAANRASAHGAVGGGHPRRAG